MNFENRWVLRSALNFASDGEIVREVGREFQRKGPEKAKADLAKECLTRVKKKREEEDDRKPGRLGFDYRKIPTLNFSGISDSEPNSKKTRSARETRDRLFEQLHFHNTMANIEIK
ncbi:hypothetical protein HELRODRAFT_170239 [Helobdella robusta]|uniref:Uncharacterized protein n=1 Tax=Helobdella robusta TaxID=6412 RepID=T1F2T5_HELRO|nr:hypothetical protein HELRODRAFT_170239 [Helobdella robusta]ESO07701.1 hypothetical protein HELRODRAFT_170239 [Helobdella robusta]